MPDISKATYGEAQRVHYVSRSRNATAYHYVAKRSAAGTIETCCKRKLKKHQRRVLPYSEGGYAPCGSCLRNLWRATE